MGYTTTFEGHVTVDPPLSAQEVDYLQRFNQSRRMLRRNGPYYIDPDGDQGIWDRAGDVMDHNKPPAGQPGLWCGWTVSNDGTRIEWDGGEKFYYAAEWMKYLIDHFLKPGAVGQGAAELEGFTFDHVVNGAIDAEGEESTDLWQLVVKDNEVSVAYGFVTYGEPDSI